MIIMPLISTIAARVATQSAQNQINNSAFINRHIRAGSSTPFGRRAGEGVVYGSENVQIGYHSSGIIEHELETEVKVENVPEVREFDSFSWTGRHSQPKTE